MRVKNGILYLILVLFLVAYLYVRKQVDEYRNSFNYRSHASAAIFPPLIIEALSGEFKGIVANYLLLEAASFIGSGQSYDSNAEDWNSVTRLLEQSSKLDPYFRHTYILTQGTLPWQSQKYDETIAILERSKKHLPWDWLPGYFIGFDYFFFMNDNLTASQKLMEASKISGAPVMLATLASRLASKAGQTNAAIDFLISVYEDTHEEQTKSLLKDRIEALKGVQQLQLAVDLFQAQFKRMPDTLEELVEKAILPALPHNPYSRPYSLTDGRVDF